MESHRRDAEEYPEEELPELWTVLWYRPPSQSERLDSSQGSDNSPWEESVQIENIWERLVASTLAELQVKDAEMRPLRCVLADMSPSRAKLGRYPRNYYWAAAEWLAA